MHPRCARARQGAATLQPAGRQQLATTSIAASLHQATYLLRLTCDWLNCTSTCYLSTPVITVTVTPEEASRPDTSTARLTSCQSLCRHCVGQCGPLRGQPTCEVRETDNTSSSCFWNLQDVFELSWTTAYCAGQKPSRMGKNVISGPRATPELSQ